MKPFCAFLLLGTLAAGQSALATSMSLNRFTPRVLPVLVQVDSHGKVTQVSPSIELSPRYDRLLRQSLDEMITRPANDHGRPVASQFVINLGLQTTPRPDGNFDAKFVYVSTSPVPSGSWYWVHVDGHRLALQSRNADVRQRFFRHPPNYHWPVPPPRYYPPVQNTTSTPPSRPPSRPPGHR
ncbi:hypothetical protein J7I44_09165 [Frateuria sp. MAH-13]|uniref:Uncharacterized protein n=1 Tax=Frateuria flava TaxID=2821489 RepID=A0ABS4DN42_9GAMM|nr:hypothetical protein [Frateuria flava]MBP1474471.1 hypothetical protein [Frateuria flava]